jgi:hypothetical protein
VYRWRPPFGIFWIPPRINCIKVSIFRVFTALPSTSPFLWAVKPQPLCRGLRTFRRQILPSSSRCSLFVDLENYRYFRIVVIIHRSSVAPHNPESSLKLTHRKFSKCVVKLSADSDLCVLGPTKHEINLQLQVNDMQARYGRQQVFRICHVVFLSKHWVSARSLQNVIFCVTWCFWVSLGFPLHIWRMLFLYVTWCFWLSLGFIPNICRFLSVYVTWCFWVSTLGFP